MSLLPALAHHRGMRRSPPVLIVDPFASGLALARGAVQAGFPVSLLTSAGRPDNRTRGIHRVYCAPWEEYASWFERIAAEQPDAVVLPSTDRASLLLADHAAELPPGWRCFERHGNVHRALVEKDTADQIARRAGVRVPWTAAIRAPEDLEAVAGEAPWPCVVKPVTSHLWRGLFGEERVFVVADADEARQRLAAPLEAGLAMLLSQYIPGGDHAVEEAILVRAADGSYPVRFGVRKLRQYPAGFGQTALGVSADVPDSIALARAVLDAADFVGVAGIETKRHQDTGEPWFIEANVRVPLQWGLGDACGADASRRLILTAAGLPLPPAPAARPGVRFVAVEHDLPLLRRRLKAAPRSQWLQIGASHLRPYLGAGEYSILDPRDPMPGLVWLGSVLASRLRPARGRGAPPG